MKSYPRSPDDGVLDREENVTSDDLQAMKDMIGSIKKDPSLLYKLSSLPAGASAATVNSNQAPAGYVDNDDQTDVSSLGMMSSSDHQPSAALPQSGRASYGSPGPGINVHKRMAGGSFHSQISRQNHDAEIALRMQSLRAKRGLLATHLNNKSGRKANGQHHTSTATGMNIIKDGTNIGGSSSNERTSGLDSSNNDRTERPLRMEDNSVMSSVPEREPEKSCLPLKSSDSAIESPSHSSSNDNRNSLKQNRSERISADEPRMKSPPPDKFPELIASDEANNLRKGPHVRKRGHQPGPKDDSSTKSTDNGRRSEGETSGFEVSRNTESRLDRQNQQGIEGSLEISDSERGSRSAQHRRSKSSSNDSVNSRVRQDSRRERRKGGSVHVPSSQYPPPTQRSRVRDEESARQKLKQIESMSLKGDSDGVARASRRKELESRARKEFAQDLSPRNSPPSQARGMSARQQNPRDRESMSLAGDDGVARQRRMKELESKTRRESKLSALAYTNQRPEPLSGSAGSAGPVSSPQPQRRRGRGGEKSARQKLREIESTSLMGDFEGARERRRKELESISRRERNHEGSLMTTSSEPASHESNQPPQASPSDPLQSPTPTYQFKRRQSKTRLRRRLSNSERSVTNVGVDSQETARQETNQRQIESTISQRRVSNSEPSPSLNNLVEGRENPQQRRLSNSESSPALSQMVEPAKDNVTLTGTMSLADTRARTLSQERRRFVRRTSGASVDSESRGSVIRRLRRMTKPSKRVTNAAGEPESPAKTTVAGSDQGSEDQAQHFNSSFGSKSGHRSNGSGLISRLKNTSQIGLASPIPSPHLGNGQNRLHHTTHDVENVERGSNADSSDHERQAKSSSGSRGGGSLPPGNPYMTTEADNDDVSVGIELALRAGQVPRMVDHKGRCLFHPHIRLQKPKLFGGWKILFKHCPDCAVEHMKKTQEQLARNQQRQNRKKKKHKHRERDRMKSSSSKSFERSERSFDQSEDRLVAEDPIIGKQVGDEVTNDSTHKKRHRRKKHSSRNRREKSGTDAEDYHQQQSKAGQLKDHLGPPPLSSDRSSLRDDDSVVRDDATVQVDAPAPPPRPHDEPEEDAGSRRRSMEEFLSQADYDPDSLPRQPDQEAIVRDLARPMKDQPLQLDKVPFNHPPPLSSGDPDVEESLALVDFKKPKSKKVNGLPWSDYNGQSGRYTGEVNEEYLPHGHGEMVYDRGHVSSGIWYNGVLDTEECSIPGVKEKYTPDRLSKYSIGDKGSDVDMIIEGKKATAAAVGEIRPNDGAFVRRSDGSWTYAIVKSRSHGDNPTIKFKVNARGSTKAFPTSQWGTYVRRIKLRAPAAPTPPMNRGRQKEPPASLSSFLERNNTPSMGGSSSVAGNMMLRRLDADDLSVGSAQSAPLINRSTDNLTTAKMKIRQRSRSRSRNRKNVTTLPLLFSSSMSVSEENEGHNNDDWETASGSGYRLRGIDP